MTELAEPGGAPHASAAPSLIRTFLIADVRGYTRFTVEHGDEAAARLATRFADLVEGVVMHHEGQVIELRGDEALAVFLSARHALHAAVALQDSFREAVAADASLPLRVGVGLDAGEAIPVKGGFRGGALNVAARLCSLAGAGDVFASETVVGLARKTEGLIFLDRGEVILKGLAGPVRVIQIAPEGEVPPDLPPVQPILTTQPTNLPDDPTPFIGREEELGRVASLIRDPHVRLATLTGPGGTGKTRLALQVGAVLLLDFPDGVFFVNLAPLTDPLAVPAAIAGALGVTEEPGADMVAALAAWLRDRQLLLVLDNYEHLLDASTVVAALLERCRNLHILVTSRIPLHLAREREHIVPPLAVPDPDHLPDLQTLTQYDSVALFIERARAARDSFAVTNDNAPAVAEICSHLDGLPLAIELAAARIKLFPPQALLQRLDKRLALLTGGAKDRPDRQQTLRAAIDWSYDLLTTEEQTLFARLSVFSGGCSFDAIEAVCNANGSLDVLDSLASLVDKNLLRQDGEVEPRFGMLATIHEYAAERLDASGEGEGLRDAQATYMLSLAREAQPFLERRLGTDWLHRLAPEKDNIRAAFRHFLAKGQSEEAAQLAVALWGFWRWHIGGSWNEGRSQLEEALARPGLSDRTRAHALAHLCNALHHQGALDRVEEAAHEVVAIGRHLADPVIEFKGLTQLWLAAEKRRDSRREEELITSCLDVASRTDDKDVAAQALRMQGFHIMRARDLGAAQRYFAAEVSLRRDRVGGDIHGALLNLGWAALASGDLDAADAAYRESGSEPAREGLALVALARRQSAAALRHLAEVLPAFQEDNHRPRVGQCLAIAAAAADDRPSLTALLLGAADAVFDDLGQVREITDVEREHIDRARSSLHEAAWDAEYARGRALAPDAAVSLVLEYAADVARRTD